MNNSTNSQKESQVTLPDANDPQALRQAAYTEQVERVLDHMHTQRIVSSRNDRD
jgi:hypothetical protein